MVAIARGIQPSLIGCAGADRREREHGVGVPVHSAHRSSFPAGVLHRGFRIAGRSDGRHRKQMAPCRVASRRKDPFGGGGAPVGGHLHRRDHARNTDRDSARPARPQPHSRMRPWPAYHRHARATDRRPTRIPRRQSWPIPASVPFYWRQARWCPWMAWPARPHKTPPPARKGRGPHWFSWGAGMGVSGPPFAIDEPLCGAGRPAKRRKIQSVE